MTHGTRGIGNVNGDIMTILKIYVCTKKDIIYVPDVGTNIVGRMSVKMPKARVCPECQLVYMADHGKVKCVVCSSFLVENLDSQWIRIK